MVWGDLDAWIAAALTHSLVDRFPRAELAIRPAPRAGSLVKLHPERTPVSNQGHGSRAVARAVLDHGRRAMRGGEVQRFFWADLDATAATDAQQGIYGPALLRTLDHDRACRASFGANIAIHAGRFRELDHPTRAGNQNAGRNRVMSRDRLAHDLFKHQTSHFEAGYINAPCN